MILVWFSSETETTLCYLSQFDGSLQVGEKNKFGDVLIGLFLVDRLENKLIPYRTSFFAELSLHERYEELKEKERKGEK